MPFQRRILPSQTEYVPKSVFDETVRQLRAEIQASTTIIEQLDFPDWTKVTGLSRGSTYKFPYNGYLVVGMAGGNGDRWISVNINGVSRTYWGDSGAYKYGWGCMQLTLPIRRNISFSFNNNTSNQSTRFAYFVGC